MSEENTSFHLQITSADVQLSSKAIQGPALPLQGIHHIHGSHGFPLGMLSVGDSITDNILQEDLQNKALVKYSNGHGYLENTPSLLVDETTDALHTTPPCESADGRLGYSLKKCN